MRTAEIIYSTIVEKCNDGMVIIQDGLLKFSNSKMIGITGYTPEEGLGKPFIDFVSPAYKKLVFTRYQERLSGKEVPDRYELEIISKDGKIIPVEINASLIEYEGRPADMAIIRDITDRKRTEKALEAALMKAEDEKNRTEAIISAIGDGIIIQDTDYRIIYQNQIQNEIYGEHLGEFCYKVYEKMDTICEDCPVELTFKDGKIHKAERAVPTDNGIKYFELTSSSLRDPSGKIIAGVKVVRDITAQKRMEEALRENERFLNSIFESIQDGICILDKDMNIIHVNPRMEGLYPHSAPLIGKKCYDAYHGRNERCDICPTWQTLNTGESAYEVVPRHGPGGKEMGWLEIYSYPMFDAKNGEMTGVIEYVRDITERKEAERKLKEAHAFLQSVINGVAEPIMVIDNNYRVKLMNQAARGGLSEVPDNLCCYQISHHSDKLCINSEHPCPLEEVRRTGRPVTVVHEHLKVSGKKRFYEILASPFYDSDGALAGIVESSRDITERKHTEEALKESEEKYRSLVENINIGITLIDINHRIIMTNEAQGKMFNKPVSEFVGKECFREFEKRDAVCAHCPGIRSMSTGQPAEVETEGVRDDGSQFSVHIHAFPFFSADGKTTGFIEVVEDITERKQAEDAIRRYTSELEESNKMKELFTDIMHHDLLNPLNTVSGFIEILRDEEDEPRKKKYLQTIERNLAKGVELIESATTLSRLESLQSIEFENIDIADVIGNNIENIRQEAEKAGMEIENRITQCMPVRANKIIEEVFSNLFSNAIKYASSGKKILVDSKETDGFWRVNVVDFGDGIKDSEKTLIFERFRRLEKKGVKGSGLGLAIAKKIMELHNGRIWIEDNPEGGAVFVVELQKKSSD